MTTIFSYLLTFFAVIFWIFRVIVALLYQLKIDFFAKPIDLNAEIIVLFLTIPCIWSIIRRNLIGATIYVGVYGVYFGTGLYNFIIKMIESNRGILESLDFLILSIGLMIPIFTFFDILINKNRVNFQGDKKTDWFYKNEAFDRKLDERADKNQYKF